jgi:opacity protein-like surface antigen
MTVRSLAPLAALIVLLTTPALAFDAKDTFRKGTFVASAEGGFGQRQNVEDHRLQTEFEFWNAGLRFSLLPLGPSFEGSPLAGAFEVGLEPFYQQYTEPRSAYFAGVGAAFRYHFLALGRLVPHLELFAAAGATDLRSREIDSDFAFLLQGGPGLSIFVTDRTALYGGYRFQHVSNGNTSRPNRGFESHTGVVGVSVFFH